MSQTESADLFPINDSFELPFLGIIRAHSRQEQVEITTPDGKPLALPMKIFYGGDGRFIRAEFFKEGAKSYQFPAKQLKEGYESIGERIVEIPSSPAPAGLPVLLRSLSAGRSLEEATRINVNYIVLDQPEGRRSRVFVAEIWGIRDEFFREQGREAFHKVRCVLDDTGKVLFFDNAL